MSQTRRIPELDMAIKWKTFYELMSKKTFRDEIEKGIVAALFCLADLPPNMDVIVRWKALCDVLKNEPFRVDTSRRGLIAGLILMATIKNG
jgi:hypothetical protein